MERLARRRRISPTIPLRSARVLTAWRGAAGMTCPNNRARCNLNCATVKPSQCRQELSASTASTCWTPKHVTQYSCLSSGARKPPHPETHGQNDIFKKTRCTTVCSLREFCSFSILLFQITSETPGGRETQHDRRLHVFSHTGKGKAFFNVGSHLSRRVLQSQIGSEATILMS